MHNEHINFYVLGHRAGSRVQVLEWSPVEANLQYSREHDRNTRIDWWSDTLHEDLADHLERLPDGLFAAYVHSWWRQGLEDGDGGIDLLAVTPIESLDWRHTWAPLRVQAEEKLHEQWKRQEAMLAAWSAEADAEADDAATEARSMLGNS